MNRLSWMLSWVRFLARLDPFYFAIFCYLVLPLFPLILEQWARGSISESSITLSTAIYAITIGVSSRSKTLLALGIGIGLIFSFASGATFRAESLPESRNMAFLAIVCVFVWHGIERYTRHIIEREPVLESFRKD